MSTYTNEATNPATGKTEAAVLVDGWLIAGASHSQLTGALVADGWLTEAKATQKKLGGKK